MRAPAPVLNASDAARHLGVSAKALRLYERHGLVTPLRTAAGWRLYGPEQLARAGEIAALRALGLSLATVARVVTADAQALEQTLAAHEAALNAELRLLSTLMGRVRGLRAGLARQRAAPGASVRLRALRDAGGVAFDLPWPWGGERFEWRDIRPLNYIIGPLGSGKTRLARRLAETLPDAAFLGLDRLADGGAAARARLTTDPTLAARVDRALSGIVQEGATASAPLLALLVGLESDGPAMLVVDMVEEGLDQSAQEALIAHLRRRAATARPLFLLTRSNAILDLAAVGCDEGILLCPANHSAPMPVDPHPGAPGFEAVATCLASPAVRARTAGVIAWRPAAA